MSELKRRQRKQKRALICVATIGGEYHASRGIVQELIPYEVECKFDQEMIDKGILSVFKNTLAPVLMPRKYPGYQGLYTHEIRDSYMVDEDGTEWDVEDRRLMNRDQLIEYIEDLDNPPCQVDADLYSDVGSLHQAVEDWFEAVRNGKIDDFVFSQNKRRERQGEAIALANNALKLNDILADPNDLVQQQLLSQFESGSNSPSTPAAESKTDSQPESTAERKAREKAEKKEAESNLSKI